MADVKFDFYSAKSIRSDLAESQQLARDEAERAMQLAINLPGLWTDPQVETVVKILKSCSASYKRAASVMEQLDGAIDTLVSDFKAQGAINRQE